MPTSETTGTFNSAHEMLGEGGGVMLDSIQLVKYSSTRPAQIRPVALTLVASLGQVQSLPWCNLKDKSRLLQTNQKVCTASSYVVPDGNTKTMGDTKVVKESWKDPC